MIETQESVSVWAEETFGPISTKIRVAARANEEMAELLRELAIDDNNRKAGEEIADIIIILYRLASRLNINVQTEIAAKMEINRRRSWRLDGTGHGYHL
jgi:NTP pyrophosphatase (non-canonical NTP hydrolase)